MGAIAPGELEGKGPRNGRVELLLLFSAALPVVLALHAAAQARAFREWVRASWWRRLAFGAAAAPCVLAAALTIPVLHRVYLDDNGLPNLEPFLRFEPPTIGEIRGADGELLIELAQEYRRVVRYRDLPLVVREAIVAAEDGRFFSHDGVDYRALLRALLKVGISSARATADATRARGAFTPLVLFPQGGSTVTQQLVRAYFLQEMTQRERSGSLLRETPATRLAAHVLGVRNANKLLRKVEEIRLSLRLERDLRARFGGKVRAKEEILARYASFVYLGRGRYGFAAASEHYFGKPLSAYTGDDADKAALLAGLAKSPAGYAPTGANGGRPLSRRNAVLARMADEGFLSVEQAEALRLRPLLTASRDGTRTHAPAAVDNVFDEIRRRCAGRFTVDDLFQGRIRVRSTVLMRLQRIVNEALEDGLLAFEKRHPEGRGLVQGSVVVLRNADGAILAEAGGRWLYRTRLARYSDYNRVKDSRRQPGSAFKPIVYLAAFRHGTRLDSEVLDAPVAVPMGPGRPEKWISNYDATFKGPIPIRQALAESRNAAAIRVACETGIDSVVETAHALGIRSRLQPYITTALGASEVSLLELASAYRAIASGFVAEPYVIEKVTDAEGVVLFEAEARCEPVPVDGAALRGIQEGLRGVVRVPGGTAYALEAAGFPIPVMGKTGTTNDYRDALFVGSTYGPQGITVAVRIGYDDNRELGNKETGGRAALPVFSAIMQRAYQDGLVGPVPRFPREVEAGIDAYLRRLGPVASPAAPDTPGASATGK